MAGGEKSLSLVDHLQGLLVLGYRVLHYRRVYPYAQDLISIPDRLVLSSLHDVFAVKEESPPGRRAQRT